MKPLVSVLLSVFNGSDKFTPTISSVLAQTFRDFEFIVVDDGSTHETSDRLSEIAKGDCRIRIISNQTNIGLTKSLNRALDVASGSLIARIDSGDAWLPTKLERQVACWNEKKDLCVLGTQASILAADGKFLETTSLPSDDAEIRKYMFRGLNPFIHSSVIFRSGVAYNPAYLCAQDVALWRSLFRQGRYFNIQDPLVVYMSDSKSLSYRKKAYQVYCGYDSFQNFVLENTGIAGNRILCGASLSTFWTALFGRLYSAAIRVPGICGKFLVCLVYATYPRVFLTRLLDRFLAARALKLWENRGEK